MGLAPVHSWLPDAHSEAPSPISALLSATLLNAAFLIILRVFKLMTLGHLDNQARILLTIMGMLSIFIAAVFVLNNYNYKRMLAYSSIENMGVIALGTAIGGVGIYAAMIHIIGHSLIKSSFFLTAGNILKQFKTKKIDEISGIIKFDKQTGWIWVLCFIGIAGLPPSPLFISEFIIVKTLIMQKQFIILFAFLFLLTIIVYGIGKSVIYMSFGQLKFKNNENKLSLNYIRPSQICLEQSSKNYLGISMIAPQIIFLLIAFTIGIYQPSWLTELIKGVVL
jgi:hydrogenase-4 component F